VSEARKVFACLAYRELGFSAASVAGFFRIDSSAVSRMLEHGRATIDKTGIHKVIKSSPG